ncbi:hypothetical protein WDU94_015330, partial [Cyamophila willieti]
LHIHSYRILVFSPSKVSEVSIKLDSETEWKTCRHVEGPLYVHSWDPSLYKEDIHTLHVRAVDESGRESSVSHPFSLDGTRIPFPVLSRLLLMVNVTIFFQLCFGVLILACVVMLCYLRSTSYYVSNGLRAWHPITRMNFVNIWLRKLTLVANIDSFFYFLALFPVYLVIGKFELWSLVTHPSTIHFQFVFLFFIS